MAKPTIKTFMKAETGGRIIADGMKVTGNADIGRFAEADSGGRISARGATIESEINELAQARNGGTIDLTDAKISALSSRLRQADIDQLAAQLHQRSDLLSEEQLRAILGAIQIGEDSSSAKAKIKGLGLWDVVERAGGLARIAQLAAMILGIP